MRVRVEAENMSGSSLVGGTTCDTEAYPCSRVGEDWRRLKWARGGASEHFLMDPHTKPEDSRPCGSTAVHPACAPVLGGLMSCGACSAPRSGPGGSRLDFRPKWPPDQQALTNHTGDMESTNRPSLWLRRSCYASPAEPWW
jgi:hypothetical protein